MHNLPEIARTIGVSERTARNYAAALRDLLHPVTVDRTRFFPDGDMEVFKAAGELFKAGATGPQVYEALCRRFLQAATPATAETDLNTALATSGNGGGNGGTLAGELFQRQTEALERVTAALERITATLDARPALPPPGDAPTVEQVETLRAEVVELRARLSQVEAAPVNGQKLAKVGTKGTAKGKAKKWRTKRPLPATKAAAPAPNTPPAFPFTVRPVAVRLPRITGNPLDRFRASLKKN